MYHLPPKLPDTKNNNKKTKHLSKIGKQKPHHRQEMPDAGVKSNEWRGPGGMSRAVQLRENKTGSSSEQIRRAITMPPDVVVLCFII